MGIELGFGGCGGGFMRSGLLSSGSWGHLAETREHSQGGLNLSVPRSEAALIWVISLSPTALPVSV